MKNEVIYIKVISVRQPYAGLIIRGIKDVENRSWGTPYRGLLAIHAGKKIEKDAFIDAAKQWKRHDKSIDPEAMLLEKEFNHGGAIIGIVNLCDIILPGSKLRPWYNGEYGWMLQNAIAIDPIPARGQLGLWTPEPRTKKQLLRLWEWSQE